MKHSNGTPPPPPPTLPPPEVSGNERADRLASTADITSGLQLDRAEVTRGLRNYLNKDMPEHHSIGRLKKRGVEKGSERHSILQGQERSVFNQKNIGTVLRATLGRLLRDGAKRLWAFLVLRCHLELKPKLKQTPLPHKKSTKRKPCSTPCGVITQHRRHLRLHHDCCRH